MTTTTIRFAAPADLTAPAPAEFRGLTRDGVRLLVAGPAGLHHDRFTGLPDHLAAGDVLVVNTSATVPGQLDAERDGLPVVVHVGPRLPDGDRIVELRSAPDAARPVRGGRPGEVLALPGDARLRLLTPYPDPVLAPAQRLWRGRLEGPAAEPGYLDRHARPISYGYLDRTYPLACYQTVFATHPGSAEMPSAGRPFTADLVTRLVARGVVLAPITLHTGLSSPEAGEGPQDEWFTVPVATASLVNEARARGGRIVAVGTTATRALESAAEPDGTVRARTGWTDLVISPDRPGRVVSGLITGWHEPEASHLLLVEAVAGTGLTQRAYEAAVAERYLWHEFGDSALLLP